MRKATNVLFILFCATTFCWSQERLFNPYFTSPFSLQTGFDSGVPDGNRKENSPVTILTMPTFSLLRTSPRNDFSISYQAQFELFTGDSHLDSWNHQAGMRWQADLAPRWSFTANDEFNGNRDNGERFDSSFILPRGPYHENGLYTSLNFDITTQTKIKFRYENAFVDFRSQDTPTPIFFSRMGNTFGGTVDHNFNPRSKLSVSYSYLISHSFDAFDPFGNAVLPSPGTHYAGATYNYQPNQTVTLEFTGGYVHNGQNSYVVGGLVEKHLQRLTIAGGFNRYLTFLGGATAAAIDTPTAITTARILPPNSITNTLSFRANGYFNEHWGIEALLLASRTGATRADGLRSAMGSLRINRRISEHMVAFAAVDLYRQNANVILPDAISRGRYFGGIEYTFSPTPDEIARRKEAARNRGVAQEKN